MSDTATTLQALASKLDDIGAAGDAARLQLHFLSSRARERTDDLATNIKALEQRLDRDIEQVVDRAATKTRQLSSALRELLGQSSAPDGQLTAGALMTDAVHVCAPDDPLNAAAQHMWEHDCGAVPIVAAGGKLVGIVTDRDICMAAYTKGVPLTEIPIQAVMARHVHACHPEDSLERVAMLMADARVRRLPVVDAQGHLVGIISLADIAKAAPVLGKSQAAQLVFGLTRAISQRSREVLGEPHEP